MLDLLAYIAVAEQPALATLVSDILSDATDDRQGEDHVVRQAMEVEQTMATVWRSRLDVSTRPRDGGVSQ